MQTSDSGKIRDLISSVGMHSGVVTARAWKPGTQEAEARGQDHEFKASLNRKGKVRGGEV